MIRRTLVLATALFFLSVGQVNAELLTNGGFEDPAITGSFVTLTSGLTGWSIDSGSIDLIQAYWDPNTGRQSIDLNGSTPGTISQSFSTVNGSAYTLSFYYANNTDVGIAFGGVEVTGTGTLLSDLTLTHSGSTPLNMNYVHYVASFVADSSTSTLSFIGFGAAANGLALDDASVVSAVPEPATLTLFGLGALGMAFAGYRRRMLVARRALA